jgi:hypothetical protein
MLKCKEFVAQADELLAGDLSLRQRLAAHFHLLICGNCRRYWRQLRLLVSALGKMGKRASDEVVDRIMQAIRAGV